MSKYTAYLMIGLARILGGMSLLVFMIFLWVGSLNLLDMHLDESGILWLDAGLSILSSVVNDTIEQDDLFIVLVP